MREVETPPRKTPRKIAKSMDADTLTQLLRDIHESDIPCPRIISAAERTRGVTHRNIPTVAEYCATADLADLVTMFAATGCRIGEVLAIRWDDVDLENRIVHITGKVVWLSGKGATRMDTTKTPAGMRSLPLPEFAVKMLSQRAKVGPLVFEAPRGGPRDPATVCRQWVRIRSALGLDGVTTHTFRKTVATLIDEEGLSPCIAADQLGHAQVSMTTDVYFGRGRTHTAVADLLDNAIARR